MSNNVAPDFQFWGQHMADNSDQDRKRYVTLGAAGAGIGLLVGIAMRPTFIGVKIPLGVLISKFPGDAPFRSELLSHLAIYLAAGAGIGCAIAFAMASVATRSPATASAPPGSQDAQKWQALVEIDPDIAAQVKRIAPFGQPYVDELAQKYLAVGDKAYLAQIAAQIVSRAETALARQKAALSDRNNKFQGFRCFLDDQSRFVGEVSVESGEFYVFASQSAFEEAVRIFLKFGRPSIASRAIAPATHIAAAE